jgi:hypothetical protein
MTNENPTVQSTHDNTLKVRNRFLRQQSLKRLRGNREANHKQRTANSGLSEAYEHRLGLQLDAELILHARLNLVFQSDDVCRCRAASVDDRQRVPS